MHYLEEEKNSFLFFVNPIIIRDEYHVRDLIGCDIQRVIDIGAHVGTFSVMCRFLFPDAEICAFEPCPDVYELLKQNTAHLGIKTFRLALGNGSYFAAPQRELMPRNTGGTSLSPGTDIPSDTFRGLLSAAGVQLPLRRNTLVKVDCEGGEKQFLNSPEDSAVLAQAGHVCFEWHFNKEWATRVNKDDIVPWVKNTFSPDNFTSRGGFDDAQGLGITILRAHGLPKIERSR